MVVHVKVMGASEKVVDLSVQPRDLVSSVKKTLLGKLGVPPMIQRLSYGGADMHDSQTLKECDVSSHTTLHLSLVERTCNAELCVHGRSC